MSRGGRRLSPSEREAFGRAARQVAPRRAHGEWRPSPDRLDPVGVLERQAAARVAELMPIRHGRMLVSPFTFYRGAAAIMAGDLAPSPRTGIRAQLCGDMHLSNFGLFGTPERRLIFDINDFDETLPGPWEWDVKRLAASMVVAARESGFSAGQGRAVVLEMARAYRLAMREHAGHTALEVWYAHLDIERELHAVRGEIADEEAALAQATIARARTRDSLRAFSRLTEVVDGRPRIISDPPLVVPIEELASDSDWHDVESELLGILHDYRRTLTTDRRHLLEQFDFVHLAHRVVGVGSVGVRAWIALFMGHDDGAPLFLQVKEAQPSVLEPYLGASAYRNSGQRVAAGKRLMQAASDIFLGWTRVPRGLDGRRRDYYVRQLHDWKGRVRLERMRPRGMEGYARLCGRTLARAHARSGDRIAIASYLGRGGAFDAAIAAFATAYADQNERDYDAFRAAVASGRLAAESGL